MAATEIGSERLLREMRQAMAKMEIALGAISEAIFWIDARGEVQWCNQSFVVLLGVSRIHLLRKDIHAIFPLEEAGVPLPRDAHPARMVLRTGKAVSGVYDLASGQEKRTLKVECIPLHTDEPGFSVVAHVEDVTEAKGFKQVRLQGIALRETGSAVAIMDGESHILWINPAFERLAGYGLAEVVGRPYFDVASAVQVPLESIFGQLCSGRLWEGETELRGKDGICRAMHQTITPVPDGEARISHHIAILTDITETKNFERELKKKDKLFETVSMAVRSLLERSDFGNWVQHFLAMLGEATAVSRVYIIHVAHEGQNRSLPEVIGVWTAPHAPPETTLPPDALPLAGENFSDWRDDLRNGKNIAEHVADLPTSKQRFLAEQGVVSSLVVPVMEGETPWGGLILDDCRSRREWSDAETKVLEIAANIIRNAIRREQQSRALKDNEERLGNILSEAVDAIVTADETGRILEVNEAACRIFGYAKGELLGQNVRMFVPPAIRGDHDQYIRNYLETGVRKVIGTGRETMAVTKDGKEVPIDLSISEISHKGRPHFTAIIRDTSERKANERALLNLNQALVEQQRSLREDLVAAEAIQKSMLPHTPRISPGVEVAWRYTPSRYVGGDILNLIPLDDGLRRMALYVVDVAGHGVPAAMVSVSVVQALQRDSGIILDAQGLPNSPSHVLRELDIRFPYERFERHFTIFYGVWDMEERTLRYSSAAHPLAYHLRAGEKPFPLLEGGTIIGLGGVLPFEEGRVELQWGDKVLIYTDGVVERENSQGEQFGLERLSTLLHGSHGLSAEMVVDRVHNMAMTFSAQPLQDDITLLGIAMEQPEKGKVAAATS